MRRLSIACVLLVTGCFSLPAPSDAATPFDAALPDAGVERLSCTGTFGSALAPSFQRLDGRLVALVAPSGPRGCRPDADHLHLQILVGTDTYDVAVTTRSTDPSAPDVFLDEITAGLPGPTFATGAHDGVSIDYPTTFGAHDGDFTSHAEVELLSLLEARLSTVDEISVFATGYSGGDGAHLVHRNGHEDDGALVLAPESPTSPVLLFHFGGQTF
jgi:hypothetical protein